MRDSFHRLFSTLCECGGDLGGDLLGGFVRGDGLHAPRRLVIINNWLCLRAWNASRRDFSVAALSSLRLVRGSPVMSSFPGTFGGANLVW